MTKVMDKWSKDLAMSDVLLEAHGIVRMAAEPWEPGDSVKAAVNRAARALGLSFRRTRSLWYCEQSCALRAHEIISLRQSQRAILQERMRRNAVELEMIAQRLAALEGTHGDFRARVARHLNEARTGRVAGDAREVPQQVVGETGRTGAALGGTPDGVIP